MSTVYIISDFGKLQKKGETLQFDSHDGTTTIFPFKTEQIIIQGNIEITSGALKLLMRNNIDTIFLGKNGKFNGKLAFQVSKNVFLRQKQFKLLEDEDFRIKFSKSIVGGKLKNQLTFMQRISRRRDNTAEIENTIEKMKSNLKKLDDAQNMDVIRGIEGLGARYFFSVFKHNIIQDWAIFKGRSMHPPEDNVNAVLSFLYTMLLFRVDAAIEAEGLDTYVGFYHSLDYGKRALTFDLMEEYRTPIADTLCCSLFNLAILEPDDFEKVIFTTESIEYPLPEEQNIDEANTSIAIQEKKGILLTKKGLKKVISHLEKKLNTLIYYQPLMRQISYKRLIHEQVKHFKRVLEGEEGDYKPLLVK
jgi:CRISPR-associated protein Cas1